MTTKMKRWTVGLVFCFLLVASSKVGAAYIIVENISQNVPSWGDCNCIPATGWLVGVFMNFTVVDTDGTTYAFSIVPADYYPRKTLGRAANTFLLDITKKNPVAPGGSYTSKKIIGLPDTGFVFTSQNQGGDISVSYCAVETVGCGGYSTGGTDPFSLFITPGFSGSDSIEFQVPAANSIVYSVVRVTFYPGNPPLQGKNR